MSILRTLASVNCWRSGGSICRNCRLVETIHRSFRVRMARRPRRQAGQVLLSQRQVLRLSLRPSWPSQMHLLCRQWWCFGFLVKASSIFNKKKSSKYREKKSRSRLLLQLPRLRQSRRLLQVSDVKVRELAVKKKHLEAMRRG